MKANHPTLPRLFLLLCLAVVSSSAHAQTPTVNLRFVSFPKAANAAPVELLLGDGKTMEVEIPTNSISETYKVPALSTWSLGKSSTNDDGKFIFQIFGKAQSNGAAEQLVLVVRKGRDDADGLDLTALNDNDESFGGGKYFLFNATTVDVAGTIGTSKFMLKPNKYDLIAPKPTKTDEDRKYAYAKIYFRSGQDAQPFFSATWRFNEAARSLVFFYHDPKSKRLRLHTIRSFAR